VREGEPGDGGDPLRVEEDEQAGDAVGGVEGVIIEQPTGLVPALVGIDDPARPGPAGRRQLQFGELLGPRPANEVADVGLASDASGGEPGIEAALVGRGQVDVEAGQPIDQSDGGLQVTLDGDGLPVGGLGAVGSSAQSPQKVPDGVSPQDVLLFGIGASCDGGLDPGLQPGHLLVPGGQGPRRHQDRTQVLNGFGPP
jgi:hypothetical protein